MAKKLGKFLLFVGSVAGVCAGIYYFLKKTDENRFDDDDFDDDDFDDFDDDDLEEITSKRTYVSLKPNSSDADGETKTTGNTANENKRSSGPVFIKIDAETDTDTKKDSSKSIEPISTKESAVSTDDQIQNSETIEEFFDEEDDAAIDDTASAVANTDAEHEE